MQDETTNITISLPESLKREIERQAAEEERTVSNYCRVLIKRILDEQEKETSE